MLRAQLDQRCEANVLVFSEEGEIHVATVCDNTAEGQLQKRNVVELFKREHEKLRAAGVSFAVLRNVPINVLCSKPLALDDPTTNGTSSV